LEVHRATIGLRDDNWAAQRIATLRGTAAQSRFEPLPLDEDYFEVNENKGGLAEPLSSPACCRATVGVGKEIWLEFFALKTKTSLTMYQLMGMFYTNWLV
jgi:hypothetical protein